MPQESAGCARVRRPALALLVGLVLMLLAHAVACAADLDDGHPHATTVAASAVHQEAGADSSRSVWVAADCALDHGADEHDGHCTLCCEPADRPAGPRVPAGTLVLAFTLIALLSLRHRVVDPVMSGGPQGGGDPAAVPTPGGSHLLNLVCVSRT
ncbi:MAG: hypothetical protein JF597_17840 [Streptomyces sp.]|uniref:hypothetical protein n=1 Tax=Streptomyces sp. TaxID=1931 RepID=UPI0025DC236C|nr:hypothetical protein [Streptomyces sp.]MBW8795387.1 hypothetical protein [Streptomyces sp.]